MQQILKKGKLSRTFIGWAVAVLCLLMTAVGIGVLSTSELSLVLYLDGTPICKVTDRTVVDEALLLLEDRYQKSGISEKIEECDFSYRVVPFSTMEVADAASCMTLLYEYSAGNYSRAYLLSVQGSEVAVLATYEEAARVVADFKEYVIDKVLQNDANIENVELTTEFDIRSIFCKRERIAEADDVYRVMVSVGSESLPELDGVPSDDRVTAGGSSSVLFPDKNHDFGPIKNEPSTALPDGELSFNISGLNSAISYKTYVMETYSEIIGFSTVYIETDELYVGQSKVQSEGENGYAENIYEIAYENGVEVSRRLVSSNVLSEAKDRVELIGTKEYPSTEPTGSFMWPIQRSFVITSTFGSYRGGFDVYNKYHTGLDIAVPSRTPIYAADGGTVISAGNVGTYGILVRIQHEEGVITYYAHMRRALVSAGDKVYKGQQIGEVGVTGVTTGPHVHFEVRINGSYANPQSYLPTERP